MFFGAASDRQQHTEAQTLPFCMLAKDLVGGLSLDVGQGVEFAKRNAGNMLSSKYRHLLRRRSVFSVTKTQLTIVIATPHEQLVGLWQ